MQAISLRVIALGSISLLGACLGEAGRSGGPNVEISVAPLTLGSVVGVSYGLTVYNDSARTAGDIVWSLDPVTSGQYGNQGGGDITYIGPCDADTPSTGDNDNFVELVLNTITVPNGLGSLGDNNETLDDQITEVDGDPDFQNPCPSGDPCVLSFECLENEDVLVEFNLTVMRGAEQGFFDIAVNFEDVFCSAKGDSCYDLDSNITLLFGDDVNDGPGRDHTFVAGFACTVGPDEFRNGVVIEHTTELLLGDANVTCGSVVFTLPLDVAGGDHNETDFFGNGYSIEYAIYHDAEELNCGTANDENGTALSCNKAFFNIAINIENLAGQGLSNCRFSFGATAQDPDIDSPVFVDGVMNDPNGVYGGVYFANVPLVDDNNETVCDAHPLNGVTLYEDAEGNSTKSNVQAGYLFGGAYQGEHPSIPLLYHAVDGGEAQRFGE